MLSHVQDAEQLVAPLKLNSEVRLRAHMCLTRFRPRRALCQPELGRRRDSRVRRVVGSSASCQGGFDCRAVVQWLAPPTNFHRTFGTNKTYDWLIAARTSQQMRGSCWKHRMRAVRAVHAKPSASFRAESSRSARH